MMTLLFFLASSAACLGMRVCLRTPNHHALHRRRMLNAIVRRLEWRLPPSVDCDMLIHRRSTRDYEVRLSYGNASHVICSETPHDLIDAIAWYILDP